MRDREHGNDRDEEEGETCSPSGVLAAECLGQGGGVSRGRGGGWQEFREKEVVETEMVTQSSGATEDWIGSKIKPRHLVFKRH